MFSYRSDRREFLQHTGAAGACCVTSALLGAFRGATATADPPAAPRVRKSIAEFVKDEDMLAAFRQGVKKMRELPSTDARSWAFQANIHWRPFFPVYVYEQAAKSTDAAQQLFRDDPGFTPEPNVFSQCPHGNWWFLPWHRAYLYYFERILRWASGESKLTLPYWNYSDAEQRELPPAFRAPMVDGRDNPLFLPESAAFTDAQGGSQVFLMRDGPLLRGETQLTASVTSLKALTVIPFSNAKPLPAALAFGSPQACDPTCGCGSGALESVPHNRIHTAVGGSSAQAGGSVRIGFMGDIATAARDPIFWLHHGNIDRLWASWSNLKQGRQNPDDPEWLQYQFAFFDVEPDGTPKPALITVQQVLNTEPLGYVYDRLEGLPETVVAVPPMARFLAGRSLRPLAATAPVKHTDTNPHAQAPQASPIQLTTAKAKEVILPLVRGVTPEQLRAFAAAKPEERKGELVLSLEGIEFDNPPGVDYDVYLNLPEKMNPNPDLPYFVGALTFFGMQHHQVGQRHAGPKVPHYVKFALPPELSKVLAEHKGALADIRVTLVPQTGTEPLRKGVRVAVPAERPAATIRQIRLLQIR